MCRQSPVPVSALRQPESFLPVGARCISDSAPPVPAPAVDTPLPPQETTPPRQEAEKAAPGVKEESSLQPSAPLETAEKNVPEYQQKYQEYLRDIKKVSAGKKMPSNPRLTKDLAKMNSDERILVDQKFNAGRDVLGDFKNALSGH